MVKNNQNVAAYSDTPAWYAIYTKQKQEDSVTKRLSNAGLHILNPKATLKKSRAGRVMDVIEPLFPCYIFAEINLLKYMRMIKYTRGVKYILFKDHPAAVNSKIIDIITSRINKEGVIRIEPNKLEKGERVIIKNGPLRGFCALFEKELKSNERVLLLLEAINASVEIDRARIEKA